MFTKNITTLITYRFFDSFRLNTSYNIQKGTILKKHCLIEMHSKVEKFHLHQNKGLQPQDSPPQSQVGRRNAEDFETKIQDYQDLIDAGSKD